MHLLFSVESLTFIFFIFSYLSICVCGRYACSHVCVQVCVDGVLRLRSGILINLLSSSLKCDLTYPQFACMIKLASGATLSLSAFFVPELQMGFHVHLTLMLILKIWTPVFSFVQQDLEMFNHLPSPQSVRSPLSSTQSVWSTLSSTQSVRSTLPNPHSVRSTLPSPQSVRSTLLSH